MSDLSDLCDLLPEICRAIILGPARLLAGLFSLDKSGWPCPNQISLGHLGWPCPNPIFARASWVGPVKSVGHKKCAKADFGRDIGIFAALPC